MPAPPTNGRDTWELHSSILQLSRELMEKRHALSMYQLQPIDSRWAEVERVFNKWDAPQEKADD